MSSPHLLNIDVDKLFEQHGINEIAQIQLRLQSEVETKREELRIMVGERYRDLLKAADTIFQMKDTSSSVVNQIANISGNCKNLNEMQLIGFKTNKFEDQKPNKDLRTFYSTTVQTKLITILHEIFWNYLDDKKYFITTQIYILARHIHTGLQLDNENSFLLYFPVGDTHWKIIENFQKHIKKYILIELENETLTSQLTNDCLLSLFLLNNLTLNDTLKIFLECRNKAFLNCLNNDENKQRRIKDRILASLKVLNSTIDLVYKCFFNANDNDMKSGKGLIHIELEKYSSNETLPTITIVPLDDPLMLETIPDIISKFKPNFKDPVLTKDNIKTISENWLKSVDEIINKQLRELIELISSMKTIQEIKNESNKMENIIKWSEKCQEFNLSDNLDFYKDKYQPLINDRVQDIIRQSWKNCITIIYDKTDAMLKLNRSNNKNDEFLYLWSENINDIPISLKEALNQQKTNNKLLMKMKGYNGNIAEICIEFDNLLNEIFTEMNVLLAETSGKIEYKNLLLEFLGNTSQEHAIELVEKIKKFDYENQFNCIVIAKLFLAFIDLCPNFKYCLSYTPSVKSAAEWHPKINEEKNIEKWIHFCQILENESFNLWKKFCDIYFKEFLTNVMDLNREMGHKIMLEDFVNWEIITIEEKDEHENPIASTIRIPSQSTISLQQFLFKFIKNLSQKIPQTLPQKILNFLSLILNQYFLQYYENIITNEFVRSNQNLSLQLYFDLKFLQSIFLDRDDKINIDKFQKLTNSLKNYIDPFDFELFYSYLCGNIKKFTHRIYQEFGLLIPNLENITAQLGEQKNSSFISTLDKDPNVLALCSSGTISIWFPLLPVVAVNTKNLTTVETQKNSIKTAKENVIQEHKSLIAQQSTAQTVKSGAAAFFGAMGQDWFR